MHWWRYVVGVLGLAFVVGLIALAQYFSSPLQGDVWLFVTQPERLPTVQAYTLPRLMPSEFPYGATVDIATVEQKTLMMSATRAPDGTVAYLSKKAGSWEVFFSNGTAERVVTQTKTIKRDLVWAPDGLSLAFSEISATSTAAERFNPDAWQVVRLLRSGDQIIFGNGVRPQILAGSETAALTSRGIVSLSLERPPKVLVASAVQIQDTPLSASYAGEKIAWINPADQSLQVFAVTPARTYEPVLMKQKFAASSLLFSEDGQSLLATRSEDHATMLVHVSLLTGVERVSAVLPYDAVLTAWIHD